MSEYMLRGLIQKLTASEIENKKREEEADRAAKMKKVREIEKINRVAQRRKLREIEEKIRAAQLRKLLEIEEEIHAAQLRKLREIEEEIHAAQLEKLREIEEEIRAAQLKKLREIEEEIRVAQIRKLRAIEKKVRAAQMKKLRAIEKEIRVSRTRKVTTTEKRVSRKKVSTSSNESEQTPVMNIGASRKSQRTRVETSRKEYSPLNQTQPDPVQKSSNDELIVARMRKVREIQRRFFPKKTSSTSGQQTEASKQTNRNVWQLLLTMSPTQEEPKEEEKPLQSIASKTRLEEDVDRSGETKKFSMETLMSLVWDMSSASEKDELRRNRWCSRLEDGGEEMKTRREH